VGYPVLPIQEGILSQLQGSRRYGVYALRQNVRNAPENIERTEPGKIVTHYTPRARMGSAATPSKPERHAFDSIHAAGFVLGGVSRLAA
jgi:hypothetical protein